MTRWCGVITTSSVEVSNYNLPAHTRGRREVTQVTIDETQGSDREVEAADEEPQPRTDVGAQWTAWQLAEHYNLCMRVNGADDLLPFTWREIMMLDGYGRDGIELRCLDDVDQYPEKFGPNTKVDKKRVKSTLKKSKDPRGGYIEASKAKIEEFLSPAASADESSDVTDDDSFVEPVLLVEPEPEGDDGEDLEVEDVDDLGVGEYLEELIARDWSAIDTWLQERVEQFKERNFDPKEPNDAVSALRIEIADLEVEFARLVLFELAAPNGRLFPDYRSKLRQTFLLEELLKHDERYLEIISSGEQADVDNLSFRTGQAARALTYGNRRLNEDDDIEGRDELPIVSFVDERRSAESVVDVTDMSDSDEPEETPPTTSDAPEPTVDVVVVTDVQPPAPGPEVSIADAGPETEPPEAPEAEDEPELEDTADDTELLAELDGLHTSGRERVAEMAEMGFMV